jgi:hypothetical protein
LAVHASIHGATESCVPAFRIDNAAMLQENASLESISINCGFVKPIKAEDYFVLVTALQHNTTLKSLSVDQNDILQLTDDEDKQMASLLINLRIGKSSRYWSAERCDRHLAAKCSRTSVSISRRIFHLERRRSVEQGK